MWCLEDSLARTSVQPVEESGFSPVRVLDFGRTWHALPMKWHHDMCAWKTPRSLLDAGWTKSLPTLPRWGSMRNGQLWQRRTLVRRISETAYGSLPTPVKYDAHGTWESNNYHGLGWLGKHGYKATDEELREAGVNDPQLALFPTPKALDYNKRGDFDVNEKRNGLPAAVRKRAFPTPIANDSTSGSDAAGRQGGASLKQTIARTPWPTPMTQGLRGGSGAPKDLETRIQEVWTQTGEDELNPEWVEWLMGWPLGWTSFDPLPENSMAVWFGSMQGPVGRARWWDTDPSIVSDMRRTCHKDLPQRESRIAALGNGQVSAVMAAAWIHLIELDNPPEEDHDD